MQKQETFDCAHAAAARPTVIHEHGVRFHVAPGQQAQDRLLRRPARQPQDARRLLRGQARARSLLQHRRLRASMPRRSAARTKSSASISTKKSSRSPSRTHAEPGARPLRAGRHLRLAARRRGQQPRSIRRRRARSGQDDARPRAGDSRAEEVPRHEQARARGREARRDFPDLLMHRPRQRGAVPRHAAPRGVLREPHGAGAEGHAARGRIIRFSRTCRSRGI